MRGVVDIVERKMEGNAEEKEKRLSRRTRIFYPQITQITQIILEIKKRQTSK
jgi:hypothetical protein